MDKGKKSIIAGAGILGGIGLYYLLSKKSKHSPPTYTCPHCGETFGTYEELVAHLAEAHPASPPPQFGRIQGRVLYEDTGKGIEGAEIYVDSRYDGLSQSGGSFQTNYYAFGTYTVTVGASDCKRGQFEVTIDSELVEVDFPLERVPFEGEWSEGIVVRKIEVVPELAYVGEEVDIKVYIEYPLPLPQLPMTLKGTILVNDVPITAQWELDKYDTTFHFSYVPSQIGDYTARSQDKSANFSATENVVSAYYHPSGAVRMPVCTEITIPDVPAFSGFWPDLGHPGGDLVLTGRSRFTILLPGYNYHPDEFVPVIESLSNAYTTKWDLAGSIVSYTKLVKTETVYGHTYAVVYVVATEYNSQQYWNSKVELAENIVMEPRLLPAEMWELVPFGSATCSRCDGTGVVRGEACRYCDGTGVVSRVDINKGIHSWVSAECISVSVIGWQGMLKGWIYCPYCGLKIETGWIKGLDFRRTNKELWVARTLLNHIEDSHPNHPLTEPAWV